MGAVYFVKDGNHRVSVARQHGMEYIDAEVIECQTLAAAGRRYRPARPVAAGRTCALPGKTRLDSCGRGRAIDFTTLGSYDLLLEHISGHRWLLGVTYGRAFEWEEAVLSWYDTVYRPLAAAIRELRYHGRSSPAARKAISISGSSSTATTWA